MNDKGDESINNRCNNDQENSITNSKNTNAYKNSNDENECSCDNSFSDESNKNSNATNRRSLHY
ncbi:hypothetical protein E2C01_080093 [Portunus trituberculatus]|uniref:Uncharacterized protein n=1 Tax=Portunus trituberculatus TaxID=210409 RepID=A0A5B7IYL4_PORTR|nr:hypothetical protein [Portunus trituberculatus]